MRAASLHTIASMLVLTGSLTPAFALQIREPEKSQDKPAGFYLKPDSIQKEVTFKTSDGWTIFGTYTVPMAHKQEEKLPAVLFLHGSLHSQTVWTDYPGWVKLQNSITTLRIDWRGCGKSEGEIPFEDFSRAQREKVTLDVEAALEFLASQPEVDTDRIGVAAEEFSVGPAIKGAMENPRVKAFVLLSGTLDQPAMDLIASNLTKSTLFIVSKEDKQSFEDLSRAYNVSRNSEREIWVQDGLGIGATMGSLWRNKNTDQPIENAIDYVAGEWLVKKLRALGRLSKVTLQTRDGWTLYANLRVPDEASHGEAVPGVILLPAALSNRSSYRDLERLLVGNNIAVLNLEWRGVGKSIGKGNFVDLPVSELKGALGDVQEGYRFLSTQKGVDPERIGILGATFSAKLAMYATMVIPKLKAVGMLTAFVWPWDQANDYKTIGAIGRPVLLVTGDGFGEQTKKFADIVSKDRRNKVLTYPGGIFGYALLRIDKRLEPEIAKWFKDQLTAGK